ncbi:MAG: hypothetical protein ACRYFX_17630 [Janthinobacterium lividum]
MNFQTWCKQHPVEHNDTWYRELYPYNVFERIDFAHNLIGIQQEIEFNRTSYSAKISGIDLQENGRYKATFELSTNDKTWKKHSWNTIFHIIYSDSYWFVTVFAKNDTLKDYVSRFKRGSFQKISLNKSLPTADLLFRTLTLQIAEEKFPIGKYNTEFAFIPEGIRYIQEHPQFIRKSKPFTPLFSVERDIWVVASFTEEKAHRLAYHLSNQCHKLYVVFCNPTYTRHHRCKHPDTHIISLYEFSNLLSDSILLNYKPQIRFLQNHLNLDETTDSKKVLSEILNPLRDEYEVQKSDLMEAWSIAKLVPTTEGDIFHYLAAMNTINAWLGRNRRDKNKNQSQVDKLFRDMYFFKTHLTKLLVYLIENPKPFTKVFIENQLTLIEIKGFQFSFHNIPKSDAITQFQSSSKNKKIEWCGKRLQPIAPLLLKYARAMKQ